MIHVIDDDRLTRESVGELLLAAELPARTYGSAASFLAEVAMTEPGCVLVDVRMPGMSGLELQEQLAARGSSLPVIVMSGHADIPIAVRAMKAGALDFLVKPLRGAEILDAVERALRLSRDRLLLAARREWLVSRYESLSAREQEVTTLIATGLRYREIASRLGLSEVTVKIHRASAMRKLMVRSTQELVRLGHELQLLGLVRNPA